MDLSHKVSKICFFTQIVFHFSSLQAVNLFPFKIRKSDATRTEPQRENPFVNFRAKLPVPRLTRFGKSSAVKIPVQVTSFLSEDAKYPPKSRKALGSLPMCATRSRQSYGGAHRDSNRDHSHSSVQAPHPVPYPFYPPLSPYPRYPSYDPYAAYHYPGSFYLAPYCAQHDITKEEPAVWSWSTVTLLILLVIGVFVIVFRSFSRESRRKIVAWLRSPRFTPQVIRFYFAAVVLRN